MSNFLGKREGTVKFPLFFYILKPNAVIEQKIESLLSELFIEEEFIDCFFIESRLITNNKLEVFIDSDSNMTFEKCRKISRFLEKHIEENDWLGEKYTLDVSSPGIGRPLKFLRQYQKNLGRKVEITLESGDKQTGILTKADPEKVCLEQKIRVKEGKKKKIQIVEKEIPFDEITKTIVQISFNK